MSKLLACAALACLIASAAAAQEEGRRPAEGSAAGVERLLKSASNAERAWGAYLAGRLGMKEHAALLAGLLEDPALAGGGWEEGYVRRAALDGLIQLGAEVPAEKLAPFQRHAPEEVIILLAREPRRNAAALLPLFVEEEPSAHWLAVGNLLAEARALGFAARLLRHMKIEAHVYVFDADGPHDTPGTGVGGGCGGGCGGAPRVPEGFPPAFYYTILEEAERGAVVFAPGRRPVYYLRTESAHPCGMIGCSLSQRDYLRVGYLADLLGTTEDGLGFDVRPSGEVVCRDEAGCLRALAGVRDRIAASHAALLARLVAAGMLDAADAAELKPDISIEMSDERARRKFPLPSKLEGAKLSLWGVEPEAGGEDEAEDEARGESDPP